VSIPFDRRCPMAKAQRICGVKPIVSSLLRISVTAGEPEPNGVRGGYIPYRPYQVPGSPSGCWQVKNDSNSRGYWGMLSRFSAALNEFSAGAADASSVQQHTII
jgi:hypothetical protein